MNFSTFIILLIVIVPFGDAYSHKHGKQENTLRVSEEPEIYNDLLKKYVDNAGNVNYEGLSTQKDKLELLLKFMSKNVPTSKWERNASLAYWINLYNAATLNLILENYPISSIMKIKGGKAWDLEIVKVGDELISLNDIENKRIRPIYNEPRIHFAVNCAAVSCPKLLNEVFKAEILDAQLDKLTSDYINDATQNEIGEKKIKLSKIFEWYKSDFEKEGSIIEFILKYHKATFDVKTRIGYMEYNWDLNGM